MSGQIPVVIVEISHTDITTLRFVNHYTDVTSNGNVYTAYPFMVELPTDLKNQLPYATITIDNVDRGVVDEIRALTGPPNITISVILVSTPDVLEAGPYEMTLKSVDYDEFTITGKIGEDDNLRETYPKDRITPNNFPGLYSGV